MKYKNYLFDSNKEVPNSPSAEFIRSNFDLDKIQKDTKNIKREYTIAEKDKSEKLKVIDTQILDEKRKRFDSYLLGTMLNDIEYEVQEYLGDMSYDSELFRMADYNIYFNIVDGNVKYDIEIIYIKTLAGIIFEIQEQFKVN